MRARTAPEPGGERNAQAGEAATPPRERRHRRRGIGRVLVIGVLSAGMAVAIVLAVGFASFREFASSNKLREELIYSSLIRDHLQRIFEDLLSAESGTLGYVVTGREEFLAPLETARDRVRQEIEALSALAWARPEHSVALRELSFYAEGEIRLLLDMADTRNRQGGLAASNVMDARRGKALMDRIRAIVSDISAAEISAAEQQTLQVRLASQRTKHTLLLLLSAAIAVVVGSSLVMITHLLARRRAELVLADTLARHRATLASAMDSIVTVNEQGRIETANPATTRMFGWSEGELNGASVALLFQPPEEAGAAGSNMFDQLAALAADGAAAREFTGRRKDGSALPVDVVVGRMEASGGHRLVAILHDISERKRADILKNEFVSTVSHELRTPLTSIAGSLGLLNGGAAGELPPGARRLVSIAHENSRRLVRLVNDILDIQKMQSASLTFAREPVDMQEVARLAIEQNTGFAAEHDVRLTLAAEPADMSVIGDQDRLIQVLTNLISNAVKFSPAEGLVTLTLERREDRVRVCVRDTGSGIPEAFRARMFTRFAQADTTDTRQRGGTGLGLAIVKEIVERHGGQISFESEVGLGTTFQVDLPAWRTTAQAPRAFETSPILLVESDSDRARVLCAALARVGISIERAETAAEGEGRAILRSYRAILIAPLLRDRDGIALLRALRRSERTRTTPLLLLTPVAAPATAAMETGAVPPSLLPVAGWLDCPPDRARIRALLPDLDRPPLLLHLCPSALARRAFAEAARDWAEVIAAASFAEARAALALRGCDMLIVQFDDPALSSEDLEAILSEAAGRLPPLVGCSAVARDPEMARLLDAILRRGKGGLAPLAGLLDAQTDSNKGAPARGAS
ncbi:MAG: ATP-binding protein [Pseudomonadota bacterium]